MLPDDAVRVTPAEFPVKMILAVVIVRSDPEESVMEPTVAVRLTAVEAVVFAVVIAVDPRLMLPRELVRTTVPASVFTLVTAKFPVAAVKLKSIPED